MISLFVLCLFCDFYPYLRLPDAVWFFFEACPFCIYATVFLMFSFMLSFFLLYFLFLAELAASYYDIEKHCTYYNDTDYDSLDADLCADHVQTVFKRLPYSCTCKRSKQKSGTAKR